MSEFWFKVPYKSSKLVMCDAANKEDALKLLREEDWDYDDNCFGEEYDFDNSEDYEA